MTDSVRTVALHPWNREFTWVDRVGSFMTLTDAQRSARSSLTTGKALSRGQRLFVGARGLEPLTSCL